MLVGDLNVAPAQSLRSAVRVLNGEAPDPLPEPDGPEPAGTGAAANPDLSEVRGQHHAVRALIVAAAGGHNCLLSGSPGTGKTMLAQRVPSILPELSRPEAIEVTRIHSIAGDLEGALAQSKGRSGRPITRSRPRDWWAARARAGLARWRSLIGGCCFWTSLGVHQAGRSRRCASHWRTVAWRSPGPRPSVGGIRRGSCSSPRRNPCPCGYAGQRERCRCSETELARYRRKLSGPLLDRIDLQAKLENAGQRGPGRRAVDKLTQGPRARDAGTRTSGAQVAGRVYDGEREHGRADTGAPHTTRREGTADAQRRPGARDVERARAAPDAAGGTNARRSRTGASGCGCGMSAWRCRCVRRPACAAAGRREPRSARELSGTARKEEQDERCWNRWRVQGLRAPQLAAGQAEHAAGHDRCRDESRLLELLELEDEQLIKAVAGARRKDLRRRWERYEARRPANRRIGRSRRIRWAWQAQWVRRPSRI